MASTALAAPSKGGLNRKDTSNINVNSREWGRNLLHKQTASG